MNASLVVVLGNGKSQELDLHRERYVVGREEGCDLRIPLAAVSRKHAELRAGSGGLVIRDLGSSNGTYVNREAVEGERSLSAGDLVAIGPVVLVVRLDGEPSDVDIVESLARGLPTTPQESAREKREPSRDDLLDDDDSDASGPGGLDSDSSSVSDFDFDLDDDDLDDQPAL